MTAVRQNRAVVPLKVNILAAAQTDRHVGGASRTADVIEEPMFGRAVLQLFYFKRLVWNGGPHFPRAGEPQDQSPEASEGVWVRAIWRGRPSAHFAPSLGPRRGRNLGRIALLRHALVRGA